MWYKFPPISSLSKERAIYIAGFILLILGLIYLFSNKIEYVAQYSNKIKSLEKTIDSLHIKNKDLDSTIKGLNQSINKLDNQIVLKNKKIIILNKKTYEKVNAVDFFSDDELEKFFTNRYGQYLNKINKTNSSSSN